jgi:hypothetical protein
VATPQRAHRTRPVRRESALSNWRSHQAHWTAAGAGVREYARVLLLRLGEPLLFRLPWERVADDCAFDNRPSSSRSLAVEVKHSRGGASRLPGWLPWRPAALHPAT